MEKNQSPAGSEPINPILDTPEPEQQAEAPAAQEPQEDTPNPQEEALAKMESRLKEKESMIGRHGNTINSLKTEIANMKAQMESSNKQQQPDEAALLSDLYKKMDSGDIGIAEGMQQALAINSNLTAAKVAQQIAEQQKQQEVSKIQTNFLENNPDYEETLQSGVLGPYLKADPLADNYTAYHLYKADQKIAGIQAETEAKIKAAQEEGARLAKGAEAAGKVIGKQGQSTMQNNTPKPFKNAQERNAAMMETLKQMRSTSS